MKNEEKAKEISDIYMPDTGFGREDLYDAALEMAEWKDDYYYNVITEIVGAAYNSCEDHAKIDEVLKKYNL